jgi:hypothetical protein
MRSLSRTVDPSTEMRLMLFLSTAVAPPPDTELEACARRMQAEVNESPQALQGDVGVVCAPRSLASNPGQGTPHIKRPGSAQEYRDSAMVGWKPLR